MSKKISAVILSLFLVMCALPVTAANNGQSSGSNSQTQQQTVVSNQGSTQQIQSQMQVHVQTVSPTGMMVRSQGATQTQSGASGTGAQVQNQNEVETRNQGDDQSLQVSTQEQEGEGMGMMSEESSERKDTHMMIDSATEKLDSILMVPMMMGSPGEKIQTILASQSDAQKQLKSELENVDARKGFLKALIGPDYQALKNMQKIMEQNQVRVRELEQLKNEVANQGDAMMIEEAVQALIDQNISLQETMETEEKANSVFGWFFRLFAR